MSILGNVVYNLLNSHTGEYQSFTKTDIWSDGTPMNDSKCDGTIYRKKGNDYFKLNWTGPVNIKWFGVTGNGITDDSTLIQSVLTTVGTIGGGDITLPNGTYILNSALNISNTNIRLIGAKNTILKATGLGMNIINILTDDVSINNISFLGSGLKSGNSSTAAIVLSGVDNCNVSNCNFTDISGGAIYLSWSLNEGVYRGCNYNTIKNNTIINCINSDEAGAHPDGAAIRVGYSQTGYFHTHNIVDGNYVDNKFKSDFGIAVEGHGYGNRVINNTVTNCVAYGILMYETAYGDGSEALVYNNIIDSNNISNIGYQDSTLPSGDRFKGMGIYLQKSHYTVVSNNTITNACINVGDEVLAQGAIALGTSYGCSVTSNSILESNRDGIYISLSFNTTVIGNSIQSSTRHGIKLQDSSNLIVSGNTIKDSNDSAIRGTFSGLLPEYFTYANNMGQTNSSVTGEAINISNNSIYRFTDAGNPTISLSGNAASGDRPDNPIPGILLVGNTIKTNKTAVNIIYSKNLVISNNSIKVYLAAYSGIVCSANCDNIKFIGNDIQGLPTNGASIVNGILYSGTNGVFLANKIQGATSLITMGTDQYGDNRKTMFKQSLPTSGDFVLGDEIRNTNPVISGTSPNRTFIKGWTYTSAGWVPQKAFESTPTLSDVLTAGNTAALPITLTGQTYRSDGTGDTGYGLYTGGLPLWIVAKYLNSSFQIARYDDSGTLVDRPIFISRANGNVGIGNNLSPVEKLDVTGNIKLTGKITFSGNIFLATGSGTPEGNLTATPGSLYLNYQGGSNPTIYTKATGTGNTGWLALNNPNNLTYTTISAIRSSTGNLTSYLYTTDIDQQGVWRYDSTDTTSTDNTGTILVTADGKRYKRIYDGPVNAKWFGLKESNSVANSVTNYNAIQGAYIWLQSLGGGELYIPEGTYSIDVTVPLMAPSNTTTYGAGSNSILLAWGASIPDVNNRPYPLTNGAVIFAANPNDGLQPDGYSIGLIRNVHFRDFAIWCDRGAGTLDSDHILSGIKIKSGKEVSITRMLIHNMPNTGIVCVESLDFLVSENVCFSNGFGQPDGTPRSGNGISTASTIVENGQFNLESRGGIITNNISNYNYDEGIQFGCVGGLVVGNNVCLGNGHYGLEGDTAYATIITSEDLGHELPNQVIISNNYIDATKLDGTLGKGGITYGAGNEGNISIVNNTIRNTSGQSAILVTQNNKGIVRIENNNIDSCVATGIYHKIAVSAAEVIVAGNKISSGDNISASNDIFLYGTIERVSIIDNESYGSFQLVRISAEVENTLKSIIIENNKLYSSIQGGVFITSSNTQDLELVSITNNQFLNINSSSTANRGAITFFFGSLTDYHIDKLIVRDNRATYAGTVDYPILYNQLNTAMIDEAIIEGNSFSTPGLSTGNRSSSTNLVYTNFVDTNNDIPGQRVITASAAPTTGTWAIGDKVVHPSPSTILGYICITAGTPGTWATLNAVDTLQTITNNGAVTTNSITVHGITTVNIDGPSASDLNFDVDSGTAYRLKVGGTEKVTISTDGILSVGNSSPSSIRAAPLQVQGNIWSTDAYLLGTTNSPIAEFGLTGTADCFVRTMGTGNVHFKTSAGTIRATVNGTTGNFEVIKTLEANAINVNNQASISNAGVGNFTNVTASSCNIVIAHLSAVITKTRTINGDGAIASDDYTLNLASPTGTGGEYDLELPDPASQEGRELEFWAGSGLGSWTTNYPLTNISGPDSTIINGGEKIKVINGTWKLLYKTT